jgi:hypothetical protein
MAQSPCFTPLANSLLLPISFPFTYLETLLGVIGSCPPWSQVADKLSPHYVPQVNGEGVCAQGGGAKSLLLLGYTGYISTTHQSLLHCTLSLAIHFNGSNGTGYTRPSIVQNTYY